MNKKLFLLLLSVAVFALLSVLSLTSCCAHEFASESVAPTCDGEGYMLHTCTLCGVTKKSDPVPALGHTYEGEREFVCSGRICTVCEYYEASEVAHEHTSEVVAPTCTEVGWNARR